VLCPYPSRTNELCQRRRSIFIKLVHSIANPAAQATTAVQTQYCRVRMGLPALIRARPEPKSISAVASNMHTKGERKTTILIARAHISCFQRSRS